jgi:riboflavin synthase
MFTGIVQGKAVVLAISGSEHLKSYKISFPPSTLTAVTRGASIAINGTCLTVTDFDESESWAVFDVMQETLKLTNIGALSRASEVNFERAATIGDEIGGHLMSGHIYHTVEVANITASPQQHTISFKTPKNLQKYLLPKGFAGLNGCSLTLGDVNSEEFNVHLIPETLEVTTFASISIGDRINLEVDPQTQAIVDTVERVLAQKKPAE